MVKDTTKSVIYNVALSTDMLRRWRNGAGVVLVIALDQKFLTIVYPTKHPQVPPIINNLQNG